MPRVCFAPNARIRDRWKNQNKGGVCRGLPDIDARAGRMRLRIVPAIKQIDSTGILCYIGLCFVQFIKIELGYVFGPLG